MPAELIIYALVAAGLVFWLKNVLGTRHGDEPERSDSFASTPENAEIKPESAPPETGAINASAHERIQELAAHPTNTLSVESKAAEIGLLDIAEADKNFDITFFLEAAQDVFVMVVEGFGKGDRKLLEDLLSKEVYGAFDAAILTRENAEETLENEIQAIRKAEILAATMKGKNAKITVKFIADEITTTKDKDGKLLAGNPERTSEMLDVWTFERDIKSRDPRWLVTETRGDVEDDNETIPNTHH